MTSMFAVFSLLLVIVVSLLVVRVATVALVLTGLSQQLARFQARSAFTGSGFTTSESEKVTQHPLRRRIIMLLMLVGNAGFVTAVSSLMLSFINNEAATSPVWFRLLALAGGVSLLWVVAHSKWIDRHMTHLIEWGLKRWTDLEVRDYSGLLHLAKGYSVVEMEVGPQDWLADQQLATLKLADEGVLILGLEKAGGDYLGAPRGQTKLAVGDVVIMYGPSDVLQNLDERRSGSDGNWDHHKAVDRQRRVTTEEQECQQRTAKTSAA